MTPAFFFVSVCIHDHNVYDMYDVRECSFVERFISIHKLCINFVGLLNATLILLRHTMSYTRCFLSVTHLNVEAVIAHLFACSLSLFPSSTQFVPLGVSDCFTFCSHVNFFWLKFNKIVRSKLRVSFILEFSLLIKYLFESLVRIK